MYARMYVCDEKNIVQKISVYVCGVVNSQPVLIVG